RRSAPCAAAGDGTCRGVVPSATAPRPAAIGAASRDRPTDGAPPASRQRASDQTPRAPRGRSTGTLAVSPPACSDWSDDLAPRPPPPSLPPPLPVANPAAPGDNSPAVDRQPAAASALPA